MRAREAVVQAPVRQEAELFRLILGQTPLVFASKALPRRATSTRPDGRDLAKSSRSRPGDD